MRLPIRARLTLISTVMMAVVLVAVGLFVNARLRGELTQSVDAGLRSRAEQIVGGLPSGGSVVSAGTVIEPDEAFAQVLAPDGTVVDASSGVEGSVLLTAARARGLSTTLTYDATVLAGGDTIPARVLAVPTLDGRVVVVGASREDQQDALRRLAALSIGGGVAALALTALVGWIVAGAALRPVERMRRQAAEISSTDAASRLAVPGTGDEFSRLAQTLNAMLDRLDTAMARERRFVSDASHELRTPLANLKAEIDLALRRPRDDERMREVVESVGEETDRLVRLAEDLLVLDGADRGSLILHREPTSIRGLIASEVSSFDARAAQQGVDIFTVAPADVTATVDPRRVREALGNLLDNALTHSPGGSRVTVTATVDGGALAISVADEGDGFAQDFLPVAFEPFTRADEGRSRRDGGAGLGLSIVRAIARAHGGSVDANNGVDGGAVVALRLPVG